jgi:methyl-accepting chemotaxis protein
VIKHNQKPRMSLASRGARYQVRIAVMLMTVIPLLAAVSIAPSLFSSSGKYSLANQSLVSVFAFVIALSGYMMLRKYPGNIVRLRSYLRDIASGELPEAVALLDSEDDFSAIEDYLNLVLAEFRNKLKTVGDQLVRARKMQRVIDSQAKEILEAERHRVMIQSVGAACHHIGQPMTVLQAHLELMKREATSVPVSTEIDDCMKAVDVIAEVLDKLRHVSNYRTVPYQTFRSGDTHGEDDEILDIEASPGGCNENTCP